MNHRLKCSSSQVCDQAGRRLGAQHGRSRRLRSRVRSLDRCRPIASANRFYWVPGRRSASLRATTDSHGVLGLRPLQSHSRISSRLNPHPLIHMLTARAAPQTQPPHGERPLRECRVQQRNVKPLGASGFFGVVLANLGGGALGAGFSKGAVSRRGFSGVFRHALLAQARGGLVCKFKDKNSGRAGAASTCLSNFHMDSFAPWVVLVVSTGQHVLAIQVGDADMRC